MGADDIAKKRKVRKAKDEVALNKRRNEREFYHQFN